MKNVSTIIALVAVGVMSGCSWGVGGQGVSSVNQDFVMAGSATGIRAFNDGLIGLAKTSKESNDAPNQYLQYRDRQEKEVTTRETNCKWCGGFFGSGKKSPPAPQPEPNEEMGS